DATDRTKILKVRPIESCIADSALCSSAASVLGSASKTTFPLDKTVFTLCHFSQLILHFLQRLSKLRYPQLFLLDHRSGGAFHKAGIRKFAVGLGDFVFQSFDFLAQAQALGFYVDFH